MRKIALIVVFAGVASLLPQKADAQVCVREVIVRSPMLELNLPPVLRVRVAPLPHVRLRCYPVAPYSTYAPPPPPPPPAPPPPPVAPPPPDPGYYHPAPPPPPPPPPPMRPVYRRIGLTLGGYVESTTYKDGAMAGGGVELRWRFARHWALNTTFWGAGSCSKCTKNRDDISRGDVGFSVGLMYFFFPRSIITPYARAALVVQHASFKIGDERFKASQAGGEFGLGLEWRITHWLAMFADASFLSLGYVKNDDERDSPSTIPSESYKDELKGIPLVNAKKGNVGGRFRLGLAIKF